MTSVVVTGATGTLGRPLVAELARRGHSVLALSRHPDTAAPTEGVEPVRGDVLDATSLAAAFSRAGTVVHAATSPRSRARRTEVAGTGNVVRAAERAGARLVYVSIVGVDAHRWPYYRAKLEAERLAAGMRGPWAIQRATQFHDLIDMFLGYPVFPRTPRLAFQPCDAQEVAVRLADAVGSDAAGMLPDFAGPEVLPIRDLARARRAARGRAAALVRAPATGFLADFDAGLHLAPARSDGGVTWAQWLAGRSGRDNPPASPER